MPPRVEVSEALFVILNAVKNLREAISDSASPWTREAPCAQSLCRVTVTEIANSVSGDERIIAAVREIVADSFQPGLRSLVLTGSLARDEGTWLHEKDRMRLAGDAEFLAVFAEHARLPSADVVAAVERAVEKRLHESGLEVHIGLSPVGPRYLRSLRPHIFAYELLEHGRVTWGDENILSLAPRFSRADIPLEDGFRLLLNRIIELLEAMCSGQGELLTIGQWLDCHRRACLAREGSRVLAQGLFARQAEQTRENDRRAENEGDFMCPPRPTQAGMKLKGLGGSESLPLPREAESLPRGASATSGLGRGRLGPPFSEQTHTQWICSQAVHYRAMKLWLDMATSFLLFQGQYE